MSLDTQLQRVLDAANAGYETFPESPNILEGFLTAISFAMEHYMASCSVDRALPLVEQSYRAATLAAELEEQQYAVVGLERLKDWAGHASHLGNMYLNAGSIELAKRFFKESLLLRQRITTEDPTNEYVQKRLAESQLDLFRLSFLATEAFPTSALDQSLLENISAAVKDELDDLLGLELARLQLLAEKYVYLKDFLNAENVIIPLLAKLENEDLSNERYAGYAAVAYWLSTAVELTPVNKGFFIDSPIDNASSSCKGLFVQWSWHLANGNTDKADAIASELWSKGYKHPRMGFYAKLAGATFPPAGISEQ